MRTLVALALIVAAACSPGEARLAAPTTPATPTEAATTKATSSPAPTASPAPTPTSDPTQVVFREDATAAPPSLDIWATSYSNLVHHWSAGSMKEIRLQCSDAVTIRADPRGGVVVTCEGGTNKAVSYRVTDAGAVAIPELGTGIPVALAPDGKQMVVYRMGDCPGPAPVCDARYMLRDVVTGTERVLLPNGYYLGASIEWTPLGLTYVQPECADAGCSGSEDRGGTFVWDGTKFARQSSLRFVAAAGQFRVYERGTQSNRADARVVLVGPAGQIDLTPAGRHERALSVNSAGEVLTVENDFIDGGLARYDATGKLIFHARMEDGSQGTRAVGDRYIVTTVYNVVGVPMFHVYDLARTLRFTAFLGDARVWVATAR